VKTDPHTEGPQPEPTDLADLEVAALGAHLRSGALSAAEVLEAVLARIDELDPLVHAIVTLAADQARETVRTLAAAPPPGDRDRPLWGIPVTVKDITPTRGIRTTRGSALRRRWGADLDAVAVERLRRDGAVIVAKTNTSEEGWKAETSNPMFPTTVNPWDGSLTAGGSSGGAAAAVACGFGPVATGTDGAGSVRIPAAFCGVVGFKPTFGAIPYWPPSAEQLSHVGPLARTVADAAVAFEALAGPDRRDPGSRVELLAAGTRSRPPRIGVVRA
jgi:aspartyl-tRNA(Asn)/glutamyl-tRNA(Gln) amidotransferase subunit A